jgi:serine/threonine-protein kinase
MNATRKEHPSPEQLRSFALGQLAESQANEVEQHVATCATCCAALRGVPDATLLCRLRAAHTMPGAPAGATMAPSGTVDQGLAVPPELANHPRYRVVKRLGAGGMGVVYLAEHRLMERTVALKVIHAHLTKHPLALERFLLELKAAARLSHPNIVTAHDAEQAGAVHFLAMEYVEGISLARLVEKHGPLSAEQAAHCLRQAALGLQHAHEKGMVHRDIKPQNLMVTRKGQVKVLDFGLARLAEEAGAGGQRPLTAVGVVLGTPDYMAPEQVIDSRRVDGRADVYSLGGTLYFLLTGQPPYPEGSALEKALSHVDGTPRPLEEARPDLPAGLADVVRRMMARDPAGRYQTPAEVAQALLPFTRAGALSVALPPDPAPAPPVVPDTVMLLEEASSQEARPRRRRVRRRRGAGKRGWLLAAVVLALLLIVGGGLLARRAWRAHGGRDAGTTRPEGGPARPVHEPGARTVPRVLLVIPHRDFWYPDVGPVKLALEKGGVKVVVASSRTEPARPADSLWPAVTPDTTLAAARPADYDAVVCAGGSRELEFAAGGAQAGTARSFLDAMTRSGKPVAALCAGTAVLAGAGVLDGKKAAGHGRIHAAIRAGGGTVVDEAVVVEGNVITGRDPQSAPAIAQAVLAALKR